jgi:hypothetical protein
LGVGCPLLPRVHIARPSFGIVVDVASRADGLRGDKLGKRLHGKVGELVGDQAKEMLDILTQKYAHITLDKLIIRGNH